MLNLFRSKEIHACAISADVEVVREHPAFFEPELREIITSIITEDNQTTGFQELGLRISSVANQKLIENAIPIYKPLCRYAMSPGENIVHPYLVKVFHCLIPVLRPNGGKNKYQNHDIYTTQFDKLRKR